MSPLKKSVLAVVLLLVFNAGLALAFYGLDLRYKTAQTFKRTGLSFDSRSPNRAESSVKAFAQTFESSEKELEISFRMKAYSIGEFNNVFQTADVNSGLRLELSKPGTLALVFGGEKVAGAFLTRSLELGKWYSVSIKIDRSGHLKASLDGVRVVDRLLAPTDYQITDLAIGAGFSKTRPFDGQIQNFSAEWRFFDKRSDGLLYTYYAIFLIGCALLIKAILVLLAPRGSRLDRRIKNLSATIATALVGFTSARKSRLAIVLLLIFNVGLMWAFYGFDLPYKTVQTFKNTGLSFDSRSPNPGESLVKEFTQTFDSREKELEISFRMKAYSIGEFNNVFQTADVNSGIRLELTSPATLAVVFGGEKMGGALLTRSLDLGRWYSVSIKIDRAGELKVFLDDAQVVDHFLGPIDYRIADLAIGTGYSKARPFDGQIQDFSVEYRFLEKRGDGFLYTFYPILLISWVFFFLKLTPLLMARSKGLDREIKINLSTTIVMVGFTSALIFHYSKGAFYGTHAPFFSTFLHYPANIFADFYSPFDHWARIGLGAPINYFPSALLILDFFFHLGTGNVLDPSIAPSPYIAVIPYIAIFVLCFFAYAYSNVASADRLRSLQAAFVLTFLSYPVLFTVHTGNMEGYVFIFTALFFYFYQKRKTGIGTFFLALAVSMKLMPVVFVVLLLADRKYREIIYTILWTVFLTILPFFIFSGNFITLVERWIQGFKSASQAYFGMMIVSSTGTHFGHSLLNGIRAVVGGSFPIEAVIAPYIVFALITFGLIASIIIFLEKSFWKRAALCVMSLNLLPFTSTDYKLLYVFIPLFLFINSESKEKLDPLYVVLFSLLLIPKDYYDFWGPYANLNVVLNPIIMLSIATLIVALHIRNLAIRIFPRRPVEPVI